MPKMFEAVHKIDTEGAPAGGTVKGLGISLEWQNGPLLIDGKRAEPNGAFPETLIEVVIQRIKFFQQTPFKCKENAMAIAKLEESILWLNARTSR